MFGRSAGQELLTVIPGADIPGVQNISRRFPDPGSWEDMKFIRAIPYKKIKLIQRRLSYSVTVKSLKYTCAQTMDIHLFTYFQAL